MAQKEAGAEGAKIWKPFGLQVQDHKGQLVKVDDPRLSPIWQMAGELGMPVPIHVADPVAFFDPINKTNERWEELGQHPDWAFTSSQFPPFMEIMEGLKKLVTRHPGTVFVGTHVGCCYAENLAWVRHMLDDCPNYYMDISARLGELGKQPYIARKFSSSTRIAFSSAPISPLIWILTVCIIDSWKPMMNISFTTRVKCPSRDAGMSAVCTCRMTCWKKCIERMPCVYSD